MGSGFWLRGARRSWVLDSGCAARGGLGFWILVARREEVWGSGFCLRGARRSWVLDSGARRQQVLGFWLRGGERLCCVWLYGVKKDLDVEERTDWI